MFQRFRDPHISSTSHVSNAEEVGQPGDTWQHENNRSSLTGKAQLENFEKLSQPGGPPQHENNVVNEQARHEVN